MKNGLLAAAEVKLDQYVGTCVVGLALDMIMIKINKVKCSTKNKNKQTNKQNSLREGRGVAPALNIQRIFMTLSSLVTQGSPIVQGIRECFSKRCTNLLNVNIYRDSSSTVIKYVSEQTMVYILIMIIII